ncbi:unnamed protein product [Mytilus edulis]|uniref:Uncharacterized protein n=1 Tax=Mytilus edulis TaxID=6550 RepID=A0A8S3Q4Q0_MYTED|nr:unnamed protein product [Mytilus edulis]
MQTGVFPWSNFSTKSCRQHTLDNKLLKQSTKCLAQIAEIRRQIQSLLESTIQHGQGFISSTPRGQGVRPKVLNCNQEHDSGIVTTGSSLSTPVGLAVGDTLPLPDRDIITNPQQESTNNISTAHTVSSGSNDVKIKPSKYDGLTPWMDYLSHFEMCALVNMWSEHQKGLYLAVSLIGQAQAVLGDLPKEKRQIFSDLVFALEERFAPSSQTELYRVQFKERRQKASETLPELGQSVRRLSNLAYPTAPLELRDTLAKERFVDALIVDSEMKLRIEKGEALVLVKQNTRGGYTKGPDTDGSVRTLKSGEKAANKDKGAVISASEDAGMYVELLIQDIFVKFVVDTGATLTLVSTKVYDLIPDLYRPHLNATKSQIKSACGNYLNLRGKGNFKLDFGTERFTSEAVVTELQVDGILGLDFMKKNKCLVDVSENIFHIDNLSVPLIFQGTLGCFRVVSTESVTIPARSEIVVSGKVCLSEGQTLPTNDVLVEASENKGKDYILTARSLVKSNDSIPVRLMNVENEANIKQKEDVNDGQNKKGLRSDLHDLLNRTSDKLSRSENQKVKSLVQEYESLFAETDLDLEPPRRTPFHLSKVVNDNIDKMLENRVIEPSHSPWAAGIVLVKKKDDTYRLCVDYRKLNSVTINKDAYPLPRIDESLDHLAGNSWFSTLDCCSVNKLNWPRKINIRRDLRLEKTLDDMLVNLRTVFDRLKSAGLKLKAKKCNLCVTMVRYLGHIISEDGIATDPEKIKVVQNWPVPTNPTEVRSFLGLCSYYRKFIKNFASIAKCLHVLTEKGKRFEWISDCQHAFDLLKIKLTNAPILTHPDFNKEFILDTDVSNVALGVSYHNVMKTSKTSSDCHKTEESQVKIVTSQMPDHDTDWTLTDKQSNDPDLKLVKQWLTDGQRPLYNEVSGKGFFIRSLWSQFNSLELQDDLVFRHFYDNERKVVKLQAVIPLSERKQVLHYCHDAKYAGHLGMRKTLEKVLLLARFAS